jgi:hypothetical protein
MIVLPTHRLLRGTPQFSSAKIVELLGDAFECRVIPGGLTAANGVWAEMETADQQGLIGLYATGDDSWILARATATSAAKMVTLASQQSDDWRGLGVSLLHRLVIDDLLGCKGHSKPTYVHDVSELIQGIRGEGSQAESDSDEPYTLAVLVMPAKLEHVEAISLHKERMPAKSTYFYPKLLSGLTFNPLG